MTKPRIFIGSSTEGSDLADAIHQNLDNFVEVTVWKHGIFQLSRPIITNLLDALEKFDFAIFVFSPDDTIIIRGNEHTTARDNVIFETGLFSGRIGIEKVFFLKPKNSPELRLPSDLLGVVVGEYDANRADKNLIAATSPFCFQVRQAIKNREQSNANSKNESIENDLEILLVSLKEKGRPSLSFSNIASKVHPRLTEERLMKMVEHYPKVIRRCKFKSGEYGIKLVNAS